MIQPWSSQRSRKTHMNLPLFSACSCSVQNFLAWIPSIWCMTSLIFSSIILDWYLSNLMHLSFHSASDFLLISILPIIVARKMDKSWKWNWKVGCRLNQWWVNEPINQSLSHMLYEAKGRQNSWTIFNPTLPTLWKRKMQDLKLHF